MPTRLIELADGTLVEVEASTDYSQQISGGLAEKVHATFDQMQPAIIKACRPVLAVCRELERQNEIESAEVEVGFGFEAEGNLYIAKATSSASIVLKLKPKGRSTAE